MPGKGKEDASTEDRQPFFPALDDRLQGLPLKSTPIPRDHEREEEGQSQEMKHPVGGQIFLFNGKEETEHGIGNEPSQLRQVSRYGHDQREQEIERSRNAQDRNILE